MEGCKQEAKEAVVSVLYRKQALWFTSVVAFCIHNLNIFMPRVCKCCPEAVLSLILSAQSVFKLQFCAQYCSSDKKKKKLQSRKIGEYSYSPETFQDLKYNLLSSLFSSWVFVVLFFCNPSYTTRARILQYIYRCNYILMCIITFLKYSSNA